MLQVKTTKAHQNERIFPTFAENTIVNIKQPCQELTDWYLCEIQGYTTYISKYLLTDNKLITDYSPTELDIEIDKPIEVIAIYGERLYAKDLKQQKYGWIPAEKVTS